MTKRVPYERISEKLITKWDKPINLRDLSFIEYINHWIKSFEKAYMIIIAYFTHLPDFIIKTQKIKWFRSKIFDLSLK